MTPAWAVAIACAIAAPACAGAAMPPPGPALTLAQPTLDDHHLRLGRAAMERSVGNLRGVVENLEPIDFSAPAFDEADRAAFLLGQAYLELGSTDRFVVLARKVAAWERASIFTRWIAFQLRVVETRTAERTRPAGDSTAVTPAGADVAGHGSIGVEAADALAASLLLRAGRADAALKLAEGLEGGRPSALGPYLEAVALAALGRDDEAALARLSTADTTTSLGRDLAGAALVRRATHALARGEDPRALLDAVPAGSRYASRARHMLGLSALERGETELGTRILETLAAEDSTYPARREVLLALAGQSLDGGRWEAARDAYRSVDRDWVRQREGLDSLLASSDFDRLWSAWAADPALSEIVSLDDRPSLRLAERLGVAAAGLDSASESLPELAAPDSAAAVPWGVPPAPLEDWREVAVSERVAAEAAHEVERVQWEIARERDQLEAMRRYLGDGVERARREAADLAARSARLDSLRRTLDALDARLKAVRDQATRRILERTAAIVRRCEDDLCWIRGMRHFHLDGPNRERPLPTPAGLPSREALVSHEETLTRGIQGFAEGMAAKAPGLIQRSHENSWGPLLVDRVIAQGADAAAALAWARALATSIDSSIAATSTSPLLRDLLAWVPGLERRADSLRADHVAFRARVARDAVVRAREGLEGEREAIDYGLAASAYGLSASLVEADSAARDSGRSADATDDPALAARRDEAIAALQAFLAHHPQSEARGEMRFRLADLEIADARQSFRERMAAYVRDQSQGRAAGLALPVPSYAAPLALYRAILEQDSTFDHRDAVLFNAGMILAEEGDPEAAAFFGDLVAHHPQSPYGQEARVRMADMLFDDRRFTESVALYEQAASGADAGLQAVALYKMGWAEYNQNRFLEAADAFRRVLDLYASEHRAQIHVDIEHESEQYLVHALAGAGGAKAFAAYFDRIGTRPYEGRILMALGQHDRRFGFFAEAVDVDELSIARYPLGAEALVSARRLVDTYQVWDRPELVLKARLAYAPHFAPRSAWAQAQGSDSVRAEGAEFARSSWKAVAIELHRKARAGGKDEDWREALRLYEAVLAGWPNDPEAASLQLNAGEAAAQLHDYPGALAHYGAAAGSAQDSVAARALWQRVAVSDAWYRSTRPAGARDDQAVGTDTLARRVVDAADQLLARYPRHPEAADLMWRQGNLSFAHGWYERAASDFGRMAAAAPADKRTPRAASLRADALFRLERFDSAAVAYEGALVAARRAGDDSLVARASQAIPISWYRHAESAVAADSTAYARHAALFEKVALGWPRYEHAPLAQYRAGLAYAKAGRPADAVRALQALIQSFPRSEYVRDAQLQIATTWEASGQREKAAEAYALFGQRYPDDASGKDAWLKGADLYAAAGKNVQADTLRMAYIRKFPGDVETAMEILEPPARRELATVGPERPISSLLVATGPKGKKVPAKTLLNEYLTRAKTHPELASRPLLAQVKFLEGEEANAGYAAERLHQPLAPSIAAKQKRLDQTIALYRQSVELGVPEWAHASTYRIGEALAAFGESLERSERPADLHGDQLRAYEDVLFDRSQPFYDRGEQVWTELLKQKAHQAPDDPWIVKTQGTLWKRLSNRFFYRPETEYPLVAADVPSRTKPEKARPPQEQQRPSGGSDETPALAHPEGSEP